MTKVLNGVQSNLSWIPADLNSIPQNALTVDDNVFIVRLTKSDGTKIGSAMKNVSIVPWNDKYSVLVYSGFEVLCSTGILESGSSFHWVKCSHGQPPKRKNAVIGGITDLKDVMYVVKAPLIYDVEGGPSRTIYSAGSLVEGANCASVPVLYCTKPPEEWPCVKVTQYEVLTWKIMHHM